MENAEKVCRRCGTLNDSRSLMCVRCGAGLEISEEEKYEILKGRLASGLKIFLLFAIFFGAYIYGMLSYITPWFDDKLLLLGESFVFEFYNNETLTYIILEVIYTLCLSLVNFVTVVLLLEMIINNKLLRINRVNIIYWFISLFVLLETGILTYYLHGSNYIIIIEHLVSVAVTIPYIKKKLHKRSA